MAKKRGPIRTAPFAFTYPVYDATAQVWDDGGENYICVQGSGAYDDGGNAFLTVAVALYLDDENPTDWPGLDSESPVVYQCNVDQSTGKFCFPFYIPGANATVRTPGAAQVIAAWGQSQDGTWPTSPTFCQSFYGHLNSSDTDCGDYYANRHAAAADSPLVVTLPKSCESTHVLCRNGGQFITVEGTGAFNPSGDRDLAVAAVVLAPTDTVPANPLTLNNPNLRIVNVDDDADGSFLFDSLNTFVPGAQATCDPPCDKNKNKLVLWPLHVGGGWGTPTVVAFYGKLGGSKSATTRIRMVRSRKPCPCDDNGKNGGGSSAAD